MVLIKFLLTLSVFVVVTNMYFFPSNFFFFFFYFLLEAGHQIRQFQVQYTQQMGLRYHPKYIKTEPSFVVASENISDDGENIHWCIEVLPIAFLQGLVPSDELLDRIPLPRVLTVRLATLGLVPVAVSHHVQDSGNYRDAGDGEPGGLEIVENGAHDHSTCTSCTQILTPFYMLFVFMCVVQLTVLYTSRGVLRTSFHFHNPSTTAQSCGTARCPPPRAGSGASQNLIMTVLWLVLWQLN